MNNFLNVMQTNNILTENGMPTNSGSGSHLVDLFYRLGASRSEDQFAIINYFIPAFFEDKLDALKLAFYARDIREGQGERKFFRAVLAWLTIDHPEIVRKNIHNIPFYGRWDDLLEVIAIGNSELKEEVADYILWNLKEHDALCAKWMPRENKKNAHIAYYLRKVWKLTPKQYRQLLVGNTKVVETLMCKKDWSSIKYDQLPSLAMNKYRKAFYRNDTDRFAKFVEAAKDGKVKINSSVLYPYQIVKSLSENYWSHPTQHEIDLAQAQWDNLPNYVREGENFIPVVDVSGSMSGQPLEVAVSLGLYLSERNIGPFKDAFITFSAIPQIQILKGNLHERIQQLSEAEWQMNTNLEAVFKLILGKAVANGLPKEDMPKTILILSDMQFDQCIQQPNNSALDTVKEMYSSFGYDVPKVVFWNLRNSFGVPTKANQSGTVLVSGFSPSIMKEILGSTTPIETVNKVINNPRYDRITL
jgi:hypothetical protein